MLANVFGGKGLRPSVEGAGIVYQCSQAGVGVAAHTDGTGQTDVVVQQRDDADLARRAQILDPLGRRGERVGGSGNLGYQPVLEVGEGERR
ncbi:MAG TPA: hypothetical protein DDY22_19440 [Geobacter sp.]|nr:hypothetical protein [Geobacter sp.]